MDIRIEVVESKGQFGEFVRFPYDHYSSYPNFVPPLYGDQMKLLQEESNTFWKTATRKLFLAFDNNKRVRRPVGRVAAIIDHRYNEYNNSNVGYFGFFETHNHPDIVNKLMHSVNSFMREHGVSEIIGPMNPSTNDTVGMLLDNFDSPPMVMMPYNPLYYNELITGFGYKKAADFYAYLVDKPEIPQKLVDLVPKLEKRGNFKLRTVDMKKLDEELRIFAPLYNECLKGNFGFVPITEDEMAQAAKELKVIADPNLILIAEVDDKPVGFSLALPDLNQILIKMEGKLFPFGMFKILFGRKNINQIRVMILGVSEEYRNKGIDLAFYYHTFKNGIERGYKAAELSWVYEGNSQMMKMAERVGARIYKTYRLYRFMIEDND